MLYTILLLLMIPFALCAPLRQWSFDKKNNGRLHTDDNMVSLSTMNLMIHDDVQGHYENILDEVISTHSEDVLIQMAHSMNDQQSLEHLLQPQAIALLHHSVQEPCLARMPGIIAHHLHRLHTKLVNSIEPEVSTLLQAYPMKITNDRQKMMNQLTKLNIAVDRQVMQILKLEGLEHKVALDLSVCEIQQNQMAPSSDRPRSFWLLLKEVWKQAAQAASSSRPGRMIAEIDGTRVTDLDRLVTVVQDESLPLGGDGAHSAHGPSLLRSYLDTIASSLQAEFNSRLPELYALLKFDVLDEEVSA